MKSSRFLVAIISAVIAGSALPKVYAQSLNVRESANTAFTLSECVSNICLRQLQVFQESVEEYIPARIVFPPRDDNGYGGYGGKTIPAHWEKYDRARIVANVTFPSCPNQYHAEGYLTVQYLNGDASITKTYQIQRSDENKTRDIGWIIKGYYGLPSNGKARISGSTKCVYHGVNNRGGPSWAPWNW